ncbi:MAG: tail fiber protein [Anaerolineaceae bacterium]|nr:tail fiber protein [Anaerolineaceae bacterium]
MALTDLPIGSIVAWKNSAIPSGWAVCDGQNGTPDLRNRIPRGASVDGDLRGTGGSATHFHGNPDTAIRPAHNHGGSKGASVSGGGTVWVTTGSGATAASSGHNHTGVITINAADEHDHEVSDTQEVSSLPRHIKRVFIRRVM